MNNNNNNNNNKLFSLLTGYSLYIKLSLCNCRKFYHRFITQDKNTPTKRVNLIKKKKEKKVQGESWRGLQKGNRGQM
jgi:hypothetical protein